MSFTIPSTITTHTPPTASAVADGDYGDIVVSGGGTVWSFDSGVVTTYARSFLNDADEAAFKATTNLEAGTDYPSLATFNSHESRHRSGGGDALSILNLGGYSSDTGDYLRGDATFQDLPTAVSDSEWDFDITKSADEDVTNSGTLQNDDELLFTVGAGEEWEIRIDLFYSGNSTTADGRWDFACSSGVMFGWYHYYGDNSASDGLQNTAARINNSADLNAATGIAVGTTASHSDVRNAEIIAKMRFTAAATVNFRFAQNNATAGVEFRVHAGSRLRARRYV